jgi:glycosyltransferase involved in cell wall biosynthesis
MASEVAVSVVIPVFNAESVFGAQLTALTRQGFTGSWEVIVADNGSTDRSAQVARDFADRLPLQVVDASSRQGASHARNCGVAASSGRLIAFCDADDIVADGWLNAIVAASTPTALIDGVRDDALLNRPDWVAARGGGRNTASTLGPTGFLPTAWGSNLGIPRAVFDELHGFDESLLLGEDADLCYRAQLSGHPLVFAPDAVIHSRYRSSLRGIFHQHFKGNLWEVELYRRYRQHGARRRPWSVVGRAWLRVIVLSPYFLLGGERQCWWVVYTGDQLSRVRGSLRFRVLYL